MSGITTFKTIMALIGILVGLLGFILGFLWFGWKLLLVVFLLMWGNSVAINYKK